MPPPEPPMPPPDGETAMSAYGCPFCGSVWCDGWRCRKPTTAYAADVPLICDPVPGGFWVIECDEKLTREQAQRLRETAEYAINAGKVLVLDKGYRIKRIDSRTEWPDAEFCAA